MPDDDAPAEVAPDPEPVDPCAGIAEKYDALLALYTTDLARLPELETENATLRDLNAEHERSKAALVTGYREQITNLTAGNITKETAGGESDVHVDEYGNATKINLGDDVLAALTVYATAHGQTEAEAIATLIAQ